MSTRSYYMAFACAAANKWLRGLAASSVIVFCCTNAWADDYQNLRSIEALTESGRIQLIEEAINIAWTMTDSHLLSRAIAEIACAAPNDRQIIESAMRLSSMVHDSYQRSRSYDSIAECVEGRRRRNR